jgi:hypothetical protein
MIVQERTGTAPQRNCSPSGRHPERCGFTGGRASTGGDDAEGLGWRRSRPNPGSTLGPLATPTPATQRDDDPDTRFAPSFDMTITTARYRCDPQTMQDIVTGAVTREQWELACRVR